MSRFVFIQRYVNDSKVSSYRWFCDARNTCVTISPIKSFTIILVVVVVFLWTLARTENDLSYVNEYSSEGKGGKRRTPHQKKTESHLGISTLLTIVFVSDTQKVEARKVLVTKGNDVFSAGVDTTNQNINCARTTCNFTSESAEQFFTWYFLRYRMLQIPLNHEIVLSRRTRSTRRISVDTCVEYSCFVGEGRYRDISISKSLLRTETDNRTSFFGHCKLRFQLVWYCICVIAVFVFKSDEEKSNK